MLAGCERSADKPVGGPNSPRPCYLKDCEGDGWVGISTVAHSGGQTEVWCHPIIKYHNPSYRWYMHSIFAVAKYFMLKENISYAL